MKLENNKTPVGGYVTSHLGSAVQHCEIPTSTKTDLDRCNTGHSHTVMIPGLGQQSIAGLLGITKQHVRVLLEEDGVVDGCIADTKSSLHHDHLQSQQNFSS